MKIEKTLSVQKREGCGKGASGRLRSEDLIPGVFYTAKGENISVQAPALPLEKIFAEAGRNSVFDLEIDDNGQKTVHPVIIWDVQYHPYKKEFCHIDYYGVDLNQPITVEVPVEFVGVSRGVKLGGQLETYREVVRLSFLHDLPHVEIAEKLGIPLGTVKSRLRLAYDKLRPLLEDLH